MWDLTWAHRPHLGGCHLDDLGGSTIERDELHLEAGATFVDENNGANVTSLQALRRNRLCQHHSVMFLYHGSILA